MQDSPDSQTDMPAQVLRIVQLSDSHLFASDDGKLRGLNTGRQFERVLSAAGKELHDADLILLTGDLAELGEPEAYRNVASRLAGFGRPVAALPGNHDDPDELARHFKAPNGASGVEIELGLWRLLLLDTTIPGESGGRLGAGRLHWLREQLALETERPVLIALHHPPLSVGSPWMDEIGLADGLDLRTCLEKHPQVGGVLFGHAHQTFDLTHGTVRYIGCPSTCVQFTPQTETVQIDPAPPGWRALELHPDGTLQTVIRYVTAPDN